jgi:uncharacterized phage protein (TIGR01671 family)
MREIKFRGKTQDGKWVYGDLIHSGTDTIAILELDAPCLELVVDVVPDTIGQFTGVLDKNGKEIYEGDVLSVREWKNLAFGLFNHDEMKDLSLDDCKGELLKNIKSLVYWDEGSMLATEQNGCSYYMCSFWRENTLITQPIFDIEIIGNIHDTPNLLTDGRD